MWEPELPSVNAQRGFRPHGFNDLFGQEEYVGPHNLRIVREEPRSGLGVGKVLNGARYDKVDPFD